ncbi:MULTISPECIES: tRNA lysidine(34) synthetase TilS [unclassified Mycobacteroides]|uniref:tRNA lysidine(34) synthetase TilS n=1 Tax=unclassified Mycobacteroides TaxID=2618759 RepID=UPI0013245626|nr:MULTISPECIES: tRNA lysidine(34) synthetase TilS [unclassified Mycobacteroides]MUM19553.1 tRNA lysidine(34) synthetase TilS [Mycobacteroides sp. CBMA 326]
MAVALSGGADSLALAAGAVAQGWAVTALIVDHGLQQDSAEVTARARGQALDLGCLEALVLSVTVDGAGGLEAAARSARYAALQQARGTLPVLLAHTLDDQAETVLLGLGRGSGGRSIAGMRPWDSPWGRPLLDIRRSETRAACVELGITPWEDPHNVDARFVRVRLRHEVLPLLEQVLGGGVAEALARTAASLQDDGDALDARARAAYSGSQSLGISDLRGLEPAVRRRVIRVWLLAGGAQDLNDNQIRAVDALIMQWRGQGGVAVGAGLPYQRLVASRSGDQLVLSVHDV